MVKKKAEYLKAIAEKEGTTSIKLLLWGWCKMIYLC
jgi:hypothetical protein